MTNSHAFKLDEMGDNNFFVCNIKRLIPNFHQIFSRFRDTAPEAQQTSGQMEEVAFEKGNFKERKATLNTQCSTHAREL